MLKIFWFMLFFVSSCFMLFGNLPWVANIYNHGVVGWLSNI